jgi:hypothetical protein
MGTALEFNGIGRYDLTTNITNNSNRGFSFWYYKEGQGGGNFGSVFSSNSYNDGIRHLGTDELNVRVNSAVAASSSVLANNGWYYITFEWDGVTWGATTDGVATGGLGSSWFVTNPQHLIGIANDNTRAVDGVLDEMRVGPARNLAWRAAEYLNQSTTTDFYTINLTPTNGSTTITDHTATQVENAFSFQNVTDGELFAFRLIPESGTATITETVITLSGANRIDPADFSNFRLLKDHDNDAQYDATDEQVGGAGVMTLTGRNGAVTFSGDFLSTTTTNYLVVADWNHPETGALLRLDLLTSGLTATDENGGQLVFGAVDDVQHNRAASFGGGGGSSAAIAAPVVVADPPQSGGGDEGGEQIGDDPDFRWPTANSGAWNNGTNAYDRVDGTYASTGFDRDEHQFSVFDHSVPGTDAITGVEVKVEASSDDTIRTLSVDLSWDGGTTWTSAQSEMLTGTDSVYEFGGPSDLWGRSWTPAEFSDANFRLRLTAEMNDDGTLNVDAIQVRVYHQATGGSAGGGGAI